MNRRQAAAVFPRPSRQDDREGDCSTTYRSTARTVVIASYLSIETLEIGTHLAPVATVALEDVARTAGQETADRRQVAAMCPRPSRQDDGGAGTVVTAIGRQPTGTVVADIGTLEVGTLASVANVALEDVARTAGQ